MIRTNGALHGDLFFVPVNGYGQTAAADSIAHRHGHVESRVFPAQGDRHIAGRDVVVLVEFEGDTQAVGVFQREPFAVGDHRAGDVGNHQFVTQVELERLIVDPDRIPVVEIIGRYGMQVAIVDHHFAEVQSAGRGEVEPQPQIVHPGIGSQTDDGLTPTGVVCQSSHRGKVVDPVVVDVHRQRLPLGAVVGDVDSGAVEDGGTLSLQEVGKVERGQIGGVVALQAEGIAGQRSMSTGRHVVGVVHAGIGVAVVSASRLRFVRNIVVGMIEAEVVAGAALDPVIVSGMAAMVERGFDAVPGVVLAVAGRMPEVVVEGGEVHAGHPADWEVDTGLSVKEDGLQIRQGVERVELPTGRGKERFGVGTILHVFGSLGQSGEWQAAGIRPGHANVSESGAGRLYT